MRTKFIYVLICMVISGCHIDATDEGLGGASDFAENEEQHVSDLTPEHYGISFVWVPPGKKMIGTNNSQSDLHERPQALFELEQGFYIGRTEVTADQYLAIIPPAKSLYAEGQHPVSVKWSEANEFCKKLNSLRASSGERIGIFRLPYEFEWEYVATYGRPIKDDWWPTHSRYPDKLMAEYENYDINAENPGSYAVNHVSNVQQLKPNPIGVYDILGNASEWCEGYFSQDVVSMINKDYEKESSFSSQRPIRGGHRLNSISELRPSIRRPRRDHHIAGFRILFDPYGELVVSSKNSDDVE